MKLKALVLLFLLVVSCLFLISPKIVNADVIFPEYINAKCNADEVLVTCDNGRSMYPLNKSVLSQFLSVNQCKQYENDPSYKFLADSGKGMTEYCYKAATFTTVLPYHFKNISILVITTLVFELAVFYLFKFRSLKVILQIVLLNFITVSAVYMIMSYLPPSTILTLIGLELGVIIFEFAVLRFLISGVSTTRILLVTFIANLLSSTVGSLVLMLSKGVFNA